MIVDKPVLRKNIEHEIEPLFDCDKGDNLFLLSYFQLKFDHSEFQRLE